LGFNTFLPPGYRIEYVPDDDSPVTTVPAAVNNNNQPFPTHQTAMHVPATGTGTLPHPPLAPASASQRKQPEFDHARNYVKKIKMRFALQPHIYKAFLEILHTYHKEQHTIKDVYEQVANLFQSHPDLLDEFTQFLPDPVANAQGGTAMAPGLMSGAHAPAQGAAVGIAGGRGGKKPRKPKGQAAMERSMAEMNAAARMELPPQSSAPVSAPLGSTRGQYQQNSSLAERMGQMAERDKLTIRKTMNRKRTPAEREDKLGVSKVSQHVQPGYY